MSTQLNHSEGNSALHQLPHVDGLTVGIVCAEWNNPTPCYKGRSTFSARKAMKTLP